MLNTDYVRSHFPAFEQPELEGWSFFENAGGSYPCRQVVDRLHHFYSHTKVQPYGPYPASRRGGEAMDESYQRLAEYLNVEPSEVSFGPSTTQNTYVLAQAFSAKWNAGDEIIVTNQDHEANSGSWRRLAEKGIVVKEWRVDPESGMLDTADLEKLLSTKTRLVAFPHCSNIVAHINPVRAICDLAHSAGARTVVDGVSYAGHGFPDVKELGTDIYLFSLYKTFGPHQGLMVIRSEALSELENQAHYFNAGYPNKKMVPAGPDHAQVAAAAGIAEYFDAIHAHHFPGGQSSASQRGQELHDLFREHERQLLTPLLNYLDARNDVRILGPTDPELRAPTVSLAVRGSAEALATKLCEHKIMCWNGDFYARRLIDALGLDPEEGALRLSFVHYTTESDIQQLIAALDATL